MPNTTAELKGEKYESARKWIELAIATGRDPRMIQRDGQWGMQQRAPRHSGQPITSTEELPPLPDDSWDELLEVCQSLERVLYYRDGHFYKTEAASC